jgi:hypothetical protein
MAGSRILFPQFRDEQRDSKYPFADGATLRAMNANLALSKSLFIDATFYIIGGGARVFLAQVVVTETRVKFVVETTAPSRAASAEYDWRTPPDNGVLALYDEHARPAGILLADPAELRAPSSWQVGNYAFGPDAAEFAATTFVPAKEPGVRAIKTAAGDFFTNDVWFIGDGGVVLRFEEPNIIRVDVVGIPLFRRFACAGAENVFPPKRFVKTINNCPPDKYGNFTLTASPVGLLDGRDDTVLRVYPTTSGLIIDAVGRSNT